MNKNQLLLPFAEREYVDMPRACRILGASWTAVVGMAASGYLRLVDYRRNGHKRVHYATLVEHCNRLREEYAIPDRRPALACELLRYRDEDILPFALRDTIGIAAPASPPDKPEIIDEVIERFTALGFKVKPGKYLRKRDGYLADRLARIFAGIEATLRARGLIPT